MQNAGGWSLAMYVLLWLTGDRGRVVTDTGRGCFDQHKENFNSTINGCCSKCPPGTYLKSPCLEGRSPQCAPCQTGTHSETWNLEERCSSCRGPCRQDMGLIEIQPCTNSSRRRCSCRSGTFCRNGMNPEDTTCTQCDPLSECPPGEGVLRPGDHWRDTHCQKCPQGTFSNVSSASDTCIPHRNCSSEGEVRSKPGNATSDTVCSSLLDRPSQRGDGRPPSGSGRPAETTSLLLGILSVLFFVIAIGTTLRFLRDTRRIAEPQRIFCLKRAFQSWLRDPEEPVDTCIPPALPEATAEHPPLRQLSPPLPRPSPEEDPLRGEGTEGPWPGGESERGGGLVGPVFIYNPARVYMGLIEQQENARPGCPLADGPRRCPSLPYPCQEAGEPDLRSLPQQEDGKENHLSEEASEASPPGAGRRDRAAGRGGEGGF